MSNRSIPALRANLEVHDRRDGTVDLRDPHQKQILRLDADELRIARRFDGYKGALELARDLGDGRRHRRVEAVAASFEELGLLEGSEGGAAEVDDGTPYGQLGSTRRRLRVLPEPNRARWSCGACGACCRGLVVELRPDEEARIDPELYRDRIGEGSFADWAFIDPELPARRVLRHGDEDGCVFLGPDNLCLVHARQGMAAKPDACQVFPMVLLHPPKGPPRVTLRSNCASMHESFESGPELEAHLEDLLRAGPRSAVYAPAEVEVFGEIWSFDDWDRWSQEVVGSFETLGLTAAAFARVDRAFLSGRLRRSRRRYGRMLLAHLASEEGDGMAEADGALLPLVDGLVRGRVALEAMRDGHALPSVLPRVSRFLNRQLQQALYAQGPLQLPDAGYGLTGLLLGVEACVHAVGPRGRTATANAAFAVFSGPIVETTHHAWPVLDAIDPAWTRQQRQEV
ncbi:MAG: YkgJ family cysteine cluster protein [Myxococcota bacterium]